MTIKINKKGTSIAEAMIVMLVVVSGVTGMYNIYIKSTQLSISTTNKIKAIQIATQGIEGITNIRDTNWLIFSSDYNNCWNTLNYNALCIGYNTDNTYQIKNNGRYKIYRNLDNRWELEASGLATNYTDAAYRTFHRVGLNNGIFTQTGTVDNLRPVFTREVLISYLRADGSAGVESDPKIKVTSIVLWVDSTSTVPHKIEMEQVLSNWKK